MPYLSESTLRRFQPSAVYAKEFGASDKRTLLASAQTTVFLSHSHDDRSFLQPAIQFLKSQGVSVYVDWMDQSMPRTICDETAEKLKVKIEEHEKFILLATSNSKNSKWVPWELGYADKTKTFDHLAVLPITPLGGWNFEGTEYVNIYPKIIEDDSGDFIVWCTKPTKWQKLSEWLKQKR